MSRMKNIWMVFAAAALLSSSSYATAFQAQDSGPNVGDDLSTAFNPGYITGKDLGTRNCIICHRAEPIGVHFWVNTDNAENVSHFAKMLEPLAAKQPDRLNVFFIFFNQGEKSDEAFESELKKMTADWGVKSVSIIYLPEDVSENFVLNGYKINRDAAIKNTVYVFNYLKVTDKFVNLEASEEGKNKLMEAVKKQLE